MVNKAQLDKLIVLYLNSNGVIVSKHYNEKIVTYETDYTEIYFLGDKISFSFTDGSYDEFEINHEDIVDIQYDIDEFNTIANIILNNKQVIAIHIL